MLILQRPWTEQPQDTAAPADGIVDATTFAAHNWTAVGAVAGVGPDGKRIKGDGSSSYAFRNVAVPIEPPMWVAAWYDVAATSTVQAHIYGLSADASLGAFISLRVASDAFGVNLFFRQSNGGNFFEVGTASASGATQVNRRVCVVGVAPTANASDAYVYINGIKYNTVAASATLSGAVASSAYETVGAMRRNTVSNYSQFSVYATARGKAISDAFAQELSLNPAGFFEPRRLYIPGAVVGASAPTLSAATFASLTSTTVRPRVTLTF